MIASARAHASDLLIVVGIVGVTALTIVFVAQGRLARSFDLALYLLVNLIPIVDSLDLAIRAWMRRHHTRDSPIQPSPTSIPLQPTGFGDVQRRMHLRPWAIVASVHNCEAELDEFLESFEKLRDHLWLIDDASSDRTVLRLRQAGFRVLESTENRKKPGAIRELLATLPSEIETVIVIDPDAKFTSRNGDVLERIEKVLFDFQRSGAAAMSPQLAIRQDGWLARLQELEYALAFNLGRKSLADHSITSGIAVYRRQALERALRRHALSVYAEDLRNTILLLEDGERIYYDERLVIETEGKRTLSGWFSQRVGWYYGLLKVYMEQLDSLRQFATRGFAVQYQFIVYVMVFSLLLHPLKLVALLLVTLSGATGVAALAGIAIPEPFALDPLYLLLSWGMYTAFTTVVLFLAVRRVERPRLLWTVPLFYFYVLFHLIPITVGYLNYLSLRAFGRRIWPDHYQDEISVRAERNGDK